MSYKVIIDSLYNPNFVYDCKYKLSFCLYYNFGSNYDLIYETIIHVRNLFSFLNYRRNISFNNIEMNSINCNNIYQSVGSIIYYPRQFFEKVDRDYIIIYHFMYEYFKDSFELIFQKIINEEIGLRYLPHSQYQKDEYSPERIIMISSTFEREFKILFNNVIEHQSSSLDRINKFKNILDNIEKSNFFNSKEKDVMKKLKNSLDFVSYSSKVNEVLKKYPLLDLEIKRLYSKNDKVYRKSDFCNSLQTLRNDIAHYNDGTDLLNNRELLIKGLEMIVFYLQLKDCKIKEDSISKLIYLFFYYDIEFGVG